MQEQILESENILQLRPASGSGKIRRSVIGTEPTVLADVYEEETNIAIWQRALANDLNTSVSDFVKAYPSFQTSITVTPANVHSAIGELIDASKFSDLCDDITELVTMFCTLFDLKRTGLRLATLEKAMCPKFHVDRVPCRLITTYQGIATEWLEHSSVNREKLGLGSQGLPDHESGLYQKPSDIKRLKPGDVGLLKGENWEGNHLAGLVHRSPAVAAGENRLLLTLDFSG